MGTHTWVEIYRNKIDMKCNFFWNLCVQIKVSSSKGMDVFPNVYRKLVGKCVQDSRPVRDSRENETLDFSQHFRNLFKIIEGNQTKGGKFHYILPWKCSQLHIVDVCMRPPFLWCVPQLRSSWLKDTFNNLVGIVCFWYIIFHHLLLPFFTFLWCVI